jgi:hypothetical protein
MVDYTRAEIQKAAILSKEEKDLIDVTGYGHIGHGNLRLNVCIPGYENLDLQDRLTEVVDQIVLEYVSKVKGSV